MEDLGKSTLWLQAKLASPSPHLHILDCRSRELYDSSHVERALSVALPGLLLRRLRKGNLSIRSLLPAPPQDLGDNMVLLYDEGTLQLTQSGEQEEDEESVLMTLLQKLREEGSPVYYLQDEALSQNCGVLVHCLAGISRSVTVTVAYLMQKLNLSLNDAYDLVKRKKSNISPNFNFMGQLLDFEKSLGLSRGSQRPPSGQSCFFTSPTDDSTFELDPT